MEKNQPWGMEILYTVFMVIIILTLLIADYMNTAKRETTKQLAIQLAILECQTNTWNISVPYKQQIVGITNSSSEDGKKME